MTHTAGQVTVASDFVIATYHESGGATERALIALVDLFDNESNVIEDDAVDKLQFDAALNAIVGAVYQSADRTLQEKTEAAKEHQQQSVPPLAEQMPKNGTT